LEGLVFAVGFIAGWVASYLFWKLIIRSSESARVLNQVSSLESELQFTQEKANDYRKNIEWLHEKNMEASMKVTPEYLQKAMENGWGYVLGVESVNGKRLDKKKNPQK
jgi:hypothetical protein